MAKVLQSNLKGTFSSGNDKEDAKRRIGVITALARVIREQPERGYLATQPEGSPIVYFDVKNETKEGVSVEIGSFTQNLAPGAIWELPFKIIQWGPSFSLGEWREEVPEGFPTYPTDKQNSRLPDLHTNRLESNALRDRRLALSTVREFFLNSNQQLVAKHGIWIYLSLMNPGGRYNISMNGQRQEVLYAPYQLLTFRYKLTCEIRDQDDWDPYVWHLDALEPRQYEVDLQGAVSSHSRSQVASEVSPDTSGERSCCLL